MSTGMTIHDIEKIEFRKKPILLDTGRYSTHLIITDEKGFKLDITLFSDNVETLKIKNK
tara:strand:+ start:271 stop:447 length:177 start_codon:yes stop_codon:yes gene_type:complete